MTENTTDKNKSTFNLHQIFVKDISFESPNSPDVFKRKDFRPKTEVDIKAKHTLIEKDQDLYEVILRGTVTAKNNEQVVFLVEVNQAGLFTVKGSDPKMHEMMLESACPSVLLPFLRETIAGLISKGGFPQFLIGPVNFDAMYMQKKEMEQKEAN
tara:strand:+ start:261 stop:725 length:465 start_codon:yes stop_codon:yes gene_type:complete